MNQPISVSSLNEQIKGLLETTFINVYVEGEISNLTYHNSGHIYFSIKDNKSVISCVMFRGNASSLKFRLEMGQKIVLTGNVTAYVPRGSYQILCTKIEPSGVGALALAYEQLKAKLQIKGYFDQSIKKPLPRYPKNIYVVTSNTGAAIEDMKKVLSHRYPLAKMILIPALVQGESAKESIVSAIKKADELAKKEQDSLMIVGRGGGSIEDLWAFNEEIVADSIYEATTPIISAVGHENDFVISDFVADLRASTPSNAIEISTPDINELKMYADTLMDDFSHKQKVILDKKVQILNNIYSLFVQNSIATKFELVNNNINNLKNNFNNSFKSILNKKEHELQLLLNTLNSNDPSKKNQKGFAQIVKDGKIVELDTLEAKDLISLQSSKVVIECEVLKRVAL